MKLKFLILPMLLLCLMTVKADGYALHQVDAGESIGYIANIYDSSVEAIARLNKLDSETVYPGDVLKIPLFEATGGLSELAPSPPPGFIAHTLVEGEALSLLAERYDLSVEAIVGANPDISSLDLLPLGLELLIPPSVGSVFVLDSPEQLIELAIKNRISPTDILELNAIASPNDVKAGMMIFLPGVKPQKALARLALVREEENRYIWPVHGRITSYFGRRNLGMGTSSFHSAIDVAAPSGTAVIASRSGTVSYAGWSNRGYGNLIKISHSGGAETWYAHHSKIHVDVGDYVRQGDIIASVGSTGLSTGPHLHFELHEQGKAIDPLAYLR